MSAAWFTLTLQVPAFRKVTTPDVIEQIVEVVASMVSTTAAVPEPPVAVAV